MRIRKSKRQHQGMPPEQVEALVRMSASELGNCHADPGPGGWPVAGAPSPVPGQPAKTPLLIGGESPDRVHGGKAVSVREEFTGYSESLVLDRNGKAVIVPGVRCIHGQKVGIDWVSCVFDPKESWMYFFVSELQDQDHFASDDVKVSSYVRNIFGWILGFSSQDTELQKWKIYSHGMNGYKYAVGMPFSAGVVHVGHSSGTVLVTVTGQGALIAKPGWEHRLHKFLRDVSGWLTRIDMAFDDYSGETFGVRKMREQARAGAFDRGGRPPKIEVRGQWDQDDPNNSGLTLYVGSRMSGKLARIYEKGKHLGDEFSPWVRAEVELHNSSYQLTLDMLLRPTQWFAAFYPVFEAVQFAGPRVDLEYRQRIAQQSIEHSFKWIRHQAGGHLAALRLLYTDTEILNRLERPEAIPEAFHVSEKSMQSLLAPSACLTDEPGVVEA